MIPVGMDYTVTVRAQRPKHVTCDGCQVEYVYFVERRAEGNDSSMLFLNNSGAQKNAQRIAERRLNEKLDRAVKAVPCPGCGLIQEHMIAQAIKQKFSHSLGLAKTAALGGGLFTLLSIPPLALYFKDGQTGALVMSLAYGPLSFLAFVWGVRKWRRLAREARVYDPNSEDLKTRLERGRKEGILLAELKRILAEQKAVEEEPT